MRTQIGRPSLATADPIVEPGVGVTGRAKGERFRPVFTLRPLPTNGTMGIAD